MYVTLQQPIWTNTSRRVQANVVNSNAQDFFLKQDPLKRQRILKASSIHTGTPARTGFV